MAISFSNTHVCNMGNLRVKAGYITMTDGVASTDFGMSFKDIVSYQQSPYSASTVGMLKWGVEDSASSAGWARIRITSITSGDAFWFQVMGF